VDTVARTNQLYRPNFQLGLTTHPIPFFGNLHTAKVLTIGVNPSADEFVGRDWADRLDVVALTDRLLHYFDSPPGPHPWFKPWIKALALLGADYARGEAAHLDLSPRATISMSSVPDANLFLGMVSHDIQWFFEFLQECSSARLLMAAGTVTERWYINEFLALHARQHGCEISKFPERKDRCTLYPFIHLGKQRPLFFSSVSPSDLKQAHVLVENVRNTKDRLIAFLN
jgi:hypothetical protein